MAERNVDRDGGTPVGGVEVRGKFMLPGEITEVQKRWLLNLQALRPVRDPDLLRIRRHYEGGRAAITEKDFPKPDTTDAPQWRRFKRLFTHINLVRPSARCWQSAVYSGSVVRNYSGIHQAEIREWINSYEHEQLMLCHNENAVVYGTSVAVASFEDDDIGGSLYDPVHTYVFTDPMNVRRVIGVAEVTPDCIRFVTLWGRGYMTPDSAELFPADYGDVLPVSIAYGYDRRHQGNPYGLSLVGDAVEMSIRVTDIAFNIAVLQKIQTRSLLVIIGELEELSEEEKGDGWGPEKVLKLSADGKAEFLTPNPLIKETLEIIRMFVAMLATATSIPQDVLDATLTQSVSSAEAARIRAIPLVQRAAQLVKEWRANEQHFIQMVAALIEVERTDTALTMKELKSAAKPEIEITPQIIPMSENELTQDVVARLAAGLIEPEDAVRIICKGAGEKKVRRMAARIIQMKSKDMAALADRANKAAAAVKGPKTADQKEQAEAAAEAAA